ncbi:MAG: DUF484 family protein, partial [Gammaproteobacteria bacterium]
LSTDLSILQSHMDGMIDRVQQNDLALRRFQAFEMKLLNLTSLVEMFENIFDDAKALFDLDVISICLVDEKDELKRYLSSDGYPILNNPELFFIKNNELLRSTFGFAVRPYLGPFRSAQCAEFFPDVTRKPSSVAIIPLNRRGKYLGALNLGSYNQNRFVRNMATDFVEHMASVVSICLENNLNFEDLKRTGLTDTLTGVNNRRFLEQRLGEEISQCQRRMEPLSCFFLDIDHFKSVNDTYGHQAGDLVLRLVAGAIKDQMRNNDIVARYGGEEFVSLLSNIDENMGTEIAERIRKKVKSLAIEYKDCMIRVTISIGFACYAPQADSPVVTEQIASALIHSADNALYVAKNKGRDCVVSNGTIPLLAKKADAG